LSWLEHRPGLTAASAGFSGVVYGNGQFVAVGSTYLVSIEPDVTGSVISTSTDGVSWIERWSTIDRGHSLRNVTCGDGQFVAVGPLGILLTSRDGMNWVQSQSGAQAGLLNAVAYGNGHFVAVGWQGTILQSGSIITLTIAAKPSTYLLTLSLEAPTGLAYLIQSSSDLISWRNLTNITTTLPTSVILDALPAASGGLFYRAYSE
jgi:hypothetical protein